MDSDPARLRARLGDATDRVIASAAALTDDAVSQPSLLPGWRRGHLLTHLARNADGLRNLLVWARTGVQIPQYPSSAARDEAIEAGSGRPAGQLTADLRRSAAAFAAEASALTGSAWQVSVTGLRGPAHPAWFVLWRRLSELELHHVDLGTGYRPLDWPEEFVADGLQTVTDRFATAEAPAALLTDTQAGRTYRIGPTAAAQPGPQVAVSGPGRSLLAWLTGRGDGAGLAVRPDGRLPAVPPW